MKRDDLIFEVKQVMTLLAELKHEPHGGGRHAHAHSQRLGELMHALHKEVDALSEAEKAEWEHDLKAIWGLHVDGGKGRTLGEYVHDGDIEAWGKEYCEHWENPDHHATMQHELHACMETLRKCCRSHKKC